LPRNKYTDRPIYLEIPELGLKLPSEIIDICGTTVKLNFDRLNLATERRLIEILYCRPGQWKHQQAPGELQSIYLLVNSILAKTKPLFKQLSFWSGSSQLRLKSCREE
jgi:cellulose synthase (UDP-forming)